MRKAVLSRRDFLRLAAAVGGSLVLPPIRGLDAQAIGPHLYLATFVGTGLDGPGDPRGNPFRARGADVPGASIFDLRPPGSLDDRWCLLGLPAARNDGPGREYLGQDPLGRSLAVKNLLEVRFGLTLSSDRLVDILEELMLVHGREDGTRWRPLVPANGQYELWLGQTLVWAQRIAPPQPIPSTVTDNFNRANENPLSGGGNWGGNGVQTQAQLIANRAVGTAASYHLSRYIGASFNADQSSQGTIAAPGTAAGGIACRCSGSAATYYDGMVGVTSGTSSDIDKVVAGARTNLATTTTPTPADNDIKKLAVTGSSLVLSTNGSQTLTATDSAITAADPPGISPFGNNTWWIDDWSATGDVPAAYKYGFGSPWPF